MPSLSTNVPETQTRKRTQSFIAIAFVLVALAYIVQCATPLRLINDGIDYLMQASSALDGHGFLFHGVRSMRPPGYPAMIFLLARLSLGTSWAIVALNCALLALGCCASYFVLLRSFEFSTSVSKLICLLTLLSYLMVRSVTYPLSDISYFGLSVPCLLLLLKAEAEPAARRWRFLLPLLALIVICIEVRTIGIVLLPAFLWAAIGGMEGSPRMYPFLRRHRLITISGVILLLIVVADVFFHSRYMQFNLPIFLKRGIVRSITANIGYHTAEWGEMMINAPLSKLPAVLMLPVRFVGGFAIVLWLVGMWTRRRRIDSVLPYVIGGACIVFVYPWFDTRLWLPFVPFLMAYMLLGLRQMFSSRLLRPLLVAYCTCFVLLGIVALGFSTRQTFAGSRFADTYGDGNFRATYKLALRGTQPVGDDKIDPDALYLLRRFEPRAK